MNKPRILSKKIVKRPKGKIFIISGPSGSGKTSLLKKVAVSRALKGKLAKSISFTSRSPRSGEKHARDYIFITSRQFTQNLRRKKILEWTKYLGYYYATPRDFVQEQLGKGKSLALCLDYRGVLQVKRIYPENTVTIFILPPSLEELKKRICGRCFKTALPEITRRLREAKNEMSKISRYDYRIMNKNFAAAAKELKGIILNQLKT